MKINISNATFSSIVGIGEKIKAIEILENRSFLHLQRGVNMVTNIDLKDVWSKIDPNSPAMQLYAPNTGHTSLKKAILEEYKFSDGDLKNISITPGGMPALDLVIQLLRVENIYFPKFYWGSYSKVATIRNQSFSFYDALLDIDISTMNDSCCVLVCDPNNPTGIKLPEAKVLNKILEIQNTGAIVIYDCPYKKLFGDYNAEGFRGAKNVIITESFSKWMGLPGLRLGFIHSTNEDFNRELNIRLLYEFNGVSSPSQVLAETILTTQEGRDALREFKEKTTVDIKKNIDWLKFHKFLPMKFYGEGTPQGIFAIVNDSEDFLLSHEIGSVGLEKFIYHERDMWTSYSRICVSVPHDEFVKYFSKMILNN